MQYINGLHDVRRSFLQNMKKAIARGIPQLGQSQRNPPCVSDNNLEWIFCGGMLRSGSTLQYNIAAEMVELCGAGRREVYIEDHGKYFGGPLPAELTVFKSHELSAPIADLFRQRKCLALISFRDVRDVVASWQAKTRKPMEVAAGLRIAESAINNFHPWEQLPSEYVLASKYEDVVDNIPAEVHRIAKLIQLKLDADQENAISTAVSVPEIERRLGDLGSEDLTKSAGMSWDTRSLVHVDHLNGGEIGRYKLELSEELADELTRRHEDWLLSHGYAL